MRAILFDLDGTLLDSIGLIVASYQHTLATHGLPARTDAEIRAGIGIPLDVQLRAWSGADPEPLMATYREHNFAWHDEVVKPYPGVVELVRALRARGLPLGLVTSKKRYGAQRGLRSLGLEDAFDVLVGYDDVARPKPHPEPVHRALEVLGVAPADAIFVGDSVHDMHAGRAAGVRTGACLWGPFGRDDLAHAEPDHWLERPSELLSLL